MAEEVYVPISEQFDENQRLEKRTKRQEERKKTEGNRTKNLKG